MSNKTTLISIALTAFVLVILAGVALAYRPANIAEVSQEVAAPLEVAAPDTSDAPIAEVSAPKALTHQAAALVAAKYLGQTDMYSVEIAQWNGLNTYKVVFTSGQIVYVSMEGQVLAAEQPTPVVVSQPVVDNTAQQQQDKGNNNRNSGKQDDDDHDDDRDDDHKDDDDDSHEDDNHEDDEDND